MTKPFPNLEAYFFVDGCVMVFRCDGCGHAHPIEAPAKMMLPGTAVVFAMDTALRARWRMSRGKLFCPKCVKRHRY